MLNPWYVTGFCDGEAVFTYSRTGGTFGLYFAIKQKGDNQQIVESIREYFNYIGYIYKNKGKPVLNKNSDIKPAIYYRVTRINELRIIIDHFDRYPLQSKRKQEPYQVWRDMVIYKIENYRDIDYDTLKALAEKLTDLNLQSRTLVVQEGTEEIAALVQ